MKNKILTINLPVMLSAMLIIFGYCIIENKMGNYITQLYLALGFGAILYFTYIFTFKETRTNPFLFVILFSTMLLATEIGKEIRIQQKNHIIYQDIRKFDELYFDGKKVIEINSEKIGATWFLGIDKTVFVLFDGTKIECIKDKCKNVKE